MKLFKRIMFFALVCMLLWSALAEPGVFSFTSDDLSKSVQDFAGVGTQEASQANPLIPTATLSPEAAALPWYLTLVNSTHPVPESWTVELYELSNGRKVDARIYPDLQAMFDACRAEGLKPKVNTAYRTYEDQKDMLVVKYKDQRAKGLSHSKAQTEALKWAAYPGYSEHQLGLAVDITTADSETCSASSVQNWMKRHCQEYGFIWRYPGVKSDITGISNEDWHFRYVGKEAAVYIMENQLCLEEYLLQQYGIE